jgi:toxin ParE1/3/4
MKRYTIAPQARADLKSIYEYIAQDNELAAGRLRDLFLQKFRLLAQQPFMGEARSDISEGLRMFPAGNYVILYRPATRGVAIVRVIHSARDIYAAWRRE